jgi:hypothetical protein
MTSACSVQIVNLRDFLQGVHVLKKLANLLRRLRPFGDSAAVFLLVPHYQPTSNQKVSREYSPGSQSSPTRPQLRILVASSSSGQ